MIFRYSAYRTDGSKETGTINAENHADCLRLLRQRNLYPSDIAEENRISSGRLSRGKRVVNLSVITRQLSVLLSSGIPIVEAIRTLSEQQRGYGREVLADIRDKLMAGMSLCRAMAGYPDVFADFYVNMIGAAETGGNLDVVLEHLAQFLETQEELRARVRAASVYPMIMLGVGAVALLFIFMFVVPKITKIFEDSRQALPFVTVVLLWVSNVVGRYWWALIALVVGGWWALRVFVARNRMLVGVMLNKVPVLNALYLSRFLRISGFLLNGGIPVLATLKLAAGSIGNAYLQHHIMEAEREIAEGVDISGALTLLPPLVRQIIATGEKTGTLPDMLLKAAQGYENEFHMQVKRLLTMLEPALLLLMGLIVGFIVFAVMLPIFELNQIVK
ncbi:MAG: type II secretion system F family protein [Candidatus Magnetobacterium sp. LHC-1]|uniref:Type II secretion system F family protein n=1 Tax=Candidatus Magnetobacterium casense TaxID=1455061 RepID=A0ABS6RYK4_9BACT|nr:type II secretion system F family protein [Candidatus Magnetobacterium casensis]MBF0608714.1 type II secretion system F family protein [Nitrospirota bacterium]MBV6341497.1 type II secretion system F family protein [Candidatus Magnetobacterium casensis]